MHERQVRPRVRPADAQADVRDPVAEPEKPVFGTPSGHRLRHREQCRSGQDQDRHDGDDHGYQMLDGARRPSDDIDHREHEKGVDDALEEREAGVAGQQPGEDTEGVPGRVGLGRESRGEPVVLARRGLTGQALRRRYRDRVGQPVRPVQVGAAATAGHQVPVRPLVVRVVVQVAREHQPQVRAGRLDDGTHEVVDRVVRARLLDRLHPARRRRTQDHLVARVHQPGHLVEVLQLRRVDVRAELRVHREQPPAVRELDREV